MADELRIITEVVDEVVTKSRSASAQLEEGFVDDVDVVAGDFGSFPGSELVLASYRSARSVVSKALRGVQKDLHALGREVDAARLDFGQTEADVVRNLQLLSAVSLDLEGQKQYAHAVQEHGFVPNQSPVAEDPAPERAPGHPRQVPL